MVGYAVAGDGQLHVVGLQSGKDLQRPARFLPANSQWSNPVAVGTMMYAATSGNCAGAPNGVYAIDLDAAEKPVVSYRTNGGSVVGAVAFSSDGNTLLAAVGPGRVTGDGKANAIVALDPKTLQLKDWFTQPSAEFVTGPTVFRQGTRDVVAAATKDGRVILLDSASLGAIDLGARRCRNLDVSRFRSTLAPRRCLGQAVGCSRDQRCDPKRRGRRRPRGGGQGCVVARARVDLQRSDDASDADHCQRSRVRAVNRPADGGRWNWIAGGALCLRRRIRPGALEQRHVDDDLCVARQLLERLEPGLRRHERRDCSRIWFPRRAAVVDRRL